MREQRRQGVGGGQLKGGRKWRGLGCERWRGHSWEEWVFIGGGEGQKDVGERGMLRGEQRTQPSNLAAVLANLSPLTLPLANVSRT